jgi:Pre-toxin domain with VENN motif
MRNGVISVTPPAAASSMVNPTERGTVMNKILILAALAFALAAGTIIDAVTIAQAAHAACISATTC